MHVGRDYSLPVSMSKSDEEFMVSPAYDVFEIKDTKVLYPEYLMMWFTRREFDRNAWFYTDADVSGGLPWKASLRYAYYPFPPSQTKRNSQRIQRNPKPHSPKPAIDTKTWKKPHRLFISNGLLSLSFLMKTVSHIKVMAGKWWKVNWERFRNVGK
jgi:hypothetical protein